MKGKCDTAQLKKMNSQLLMDALYVSDAATKQALSETTGLSLATCTALLAELIEAGRVAELALASPRGGRPARRFALNPDCTHSLCLFVEQWHGEARIVSSVFDAKGRAVRERALTSGAITPEVIRQLAGEMIAGDPRVVSIAVGIPGVTRDGMIFQCDIAALDGFDLGGYLSKRLSCAVLVRNDLNMIAYGFYKRELSHEAISTVVVAAWPRNALPGAGIVASGRVIEGKSHFAGEIASFPFPFDRDEQYRRLHDPAAFMPLATQVLKGFICLLNPDVIAITGELALRHAQSEFEEGCLDGIAPEHMPRFIRCETVDAAYLEGLFHLCKEHDACPVAMVYK